MPDKIGVAIIGVGGIVLDQHLKHLSTMPEVRIVGYLRNKSGRAEQASKTYGGRVYESADEICDDADVHAVYISVPPFAHGDIERKALAAGKGLFIEKPLGVDLQTVESIAEQVRSKNAITAVCYHWRYQSTTADVKRRLAGVPIVGATGWWCDGRPDVWWWRDKATSGGQAVEQTTHLFDLANHLIGSRPISVYATGRQLGVFDDPKHKVDDVSLAQVRYENGVAISLWSSDVMRGKSKKVGFEIYGVDRRYELGLGSLLTDEKNGEQKLTNEGNPYQRANAAFIHAMRTGDRSQILSDYETSLVTHRVTMAVERSITSGKVEQV